MERIATFALLVALAAAVGCGSSDSPEPQASDPDRSSTTEAVSDTSASSSTTVTTTSPPASTTTAPTSTTTTPPPATTPSTTTSPPTTAPPDPGPLTRGDEGAAVTGLQARLDDLGYWVGPHDGTYGELTEQAVFAFQKAQGLRVDGVAGPTTHSALASPEPAGTRSTSGTVWEVDKTRQLLILAVDGRAETVWNTSTGTEAPYTHDGRQLLADTPPGRFSISWQVDGWRDGALGRMWRPKYFHRDGIAIHGYPRVPPVPASHGCVRVTMAAMDHIWASGHASIGASVHVYGQAPT